MGVKTPHIADLSHELWAECWTNAEHSHDDWVLRKLSRQRLHLLLERSESRGGRFELRYGLFYK